MNSARKTWICRSGKAPMIAALVAAAAFGTAARADNTPGATPKEQATPMLQPLHVTAWTLAGVLTDRPGPGRDETPGPQVRLYDNTSLKALAVSDIQPHRAGEDISLTPGACRAGPVRLTSAELGMYVNPGPNGEASFDVACVFYSSFDPAADPVNTGFLGGFIIKVRNVPGDASYTTGPIDLRPIYPQGVPINNERFFVDIRFLQPDSATLLSARATPLFAGPHATQGSSADMYWRDVDGNGQYGPKEARNFGGFPAPANFYLALDGVVEPICAADFNHDGALNTQDFFDFMGAYFNEDPGADFNQDGTITSQDFFDYLTTYMTGCA